MFFAANYGRKNSELENRAAWGRQPALYFLQYANFNPHEQIVPHHKRPPFEGSSA